MFKCFLDIYCESCIKDTVTNKTCKISVLVEHTLFWLKSSFGFFCKMVQKNLNKLFCQPNILVKEVPKKGKEKKKKTKPDISDRGKCYKEEEQDLVMGWV